jgi:two-component system sensor histidine kinase BaeS
MSLPVAAHKRLGLKVIEVCEPIPVLLDPIRIRQVFNNVLENAIRYSPINSQIYVRIERVRSDVVVSVKDNGPGIDAAQLETLFTPVHARCAESRAESGTGMGLTIARHIVELHGGLIVAESELGRGTTMKVFLPAPSE